MRWLFTECFQFGDLHAMGKDSVALSTDTKAVTSVEFTEEDAKKAVSTGGTLTRNSTLKPAQRLLRMGVL